MTFPELSYQSLWRNRLARSAVNRKVGGSSPPRDEMSPFRLNLFWGETVFVSFYKHEANFIEPFKHINSRKSGLEDYLSNQTFSVVLCYAKTSKIQVENS